MHFYRTPYILTLLSNYLLWKVPTTSKEIYLTFDDGPIPQLTEYVLDLLKEFGAEATFFCVGDNIKKHPEIFCEVLKQGHAVGNHTFHHLKAWSTNNKSFLENVEKCDSMINDTGNEPSSLFRPPHGQISPKLINDLKNGHKIIMWDVLTYDFNKQHPPEFSLKKAIQKTRPGSIVVFHDNYKAEKKLKYMLPRYLEHFSDLGYEFKKLPSS